MSSSSNVWNLCSNCCFLFEKLQDFLLARRLLWEPPDMFIGAHRELFWCKGSLFSKPFSVHFFSEKWWQMDTKMASKVETILSKMTLKNPPFIFSGNTQKSNRKSKKGCQHIIKIYEKWTLELNKKRCLKTYSNKAKNVQKMIPNSGSKSEGIFGVASRGAPLAAYFIFWGLLGPSWGLLGPSWSHLGASWGHLGASWGLLGPSWGHLWASWVHIGASCAAQSQARRNARSD